MPKITISEKHTLTQDVVAERIKSNITAAIQSNTALVSEYSDEWVDQHTMKFNFKVFGLPISGVAKALAEEMTVETDLPLAAMMMKGMIESKLREEMKKALA